MARGLVARPDLVLFDEPLSNLDARLRDQVRSHIHELHGRLKFTAVFVTHDQTEALALGDRLAIMNQGRIEQLDTARNVFEDPQSEYVANFMGMSNRIVLDRQGGVWRCSGEAVQGLDDHRDRTPKLIARVREQDLLVLPEGRPLSDQSVAMRGVVVDITYAGRHLDVVVSVGSERFYGQCSSSSPSGLKVGESVLIQFLARSATLFDEAGLRVRRVD